MPGAVPHEADSALANDTWVRLARTAGAEELLLPPQAASSSALASKAVARAGREIGEVRTKGILRHPLEPVIAWQRVRPSGKWLVR